MDAEIKARLLQIVNELDLHACSDHIKQQKPELWQELKDKLHINHTSSMTSMIPMMLGQFSFPFGATCPNCQQLAVDLKQAKTEIDSLRREVKGTNDQNMQLEKEIEKINRRNKEADEDNVRRSIMVNIEYEMKLDYISHCKPDTVKRYQDRFGDWMEKKLLNTSLEDIEKDFMAEASSQDQTKLDTYWKWGTKNDRMCYKSICWVMKRFNTNAHLITLDDKDVGYDRCKELISVLQGANYDNMLFYLNRLSEKRAEQNDAKFLHNSIN